MRIIQTRTRKGTVQNYLLWMHRGIMDEWEIAEFVDALIASIRERPVRPVGHFDRVEAAQIDRAFALSDVSVMWSNGVAHEI